MRPTRVVRPQICREGAIYLHIGLQSGRRTHGGSQFDFKPQIQREANCMISFLMRGDQVSYMPPSPGISCSDTADARELRLSSPGRQLYPKGLG